MANRLKMAQVEMILALIEQGWSRRRIARELSVHRDTVARYVMQARQQAQAPPMHGADDSKPAILHTGSEGGPEAKPAIPLTGFSDVFRSKPAILLTGSAAGRKSQCEPLSETISQKMDAGLSAQRIHQDLVTSRASLAAIQPCSGMSSVWARGGSFRSGAWNAMEALKRRSTSAAVRQLSGRRARGAAMSSGSC